MSLSGVYAIRNTRTSALYIGSTIHLPTRWTQHRSELARGRHTNPRLQAAWNEDGPEAFVIELLEPVIPPHHDALNNAEERQFARLQAEGALLYSNKHQPRAAGWYREMPPAPIAVPATWSEREIGRWLNLSKKTVRNWLEGGLIVRVDQVDAN